MCSYKNWTKRINSNNSPLMNTIIKNIFICIPAISLRNDIDFYFNPRLFIVIQRLILTVQFLIFTITQNSKQIFEMNKFLNIGLKTFFKPKRKTTKENLGYQILSKSTRNTRKRRLNSVLFDSNMQTCLCQSKLGLKLMWYIS